MRLISIAGNKWTTRSNFNSQMQKMMSNELKITWYLIYVIENLLRKIIDFYKRLIAVGALFFLLHCRIIFQKESTIKFINQFILIDYRKTRGKLMKISLDLKFWLKCMDRSFDPGELINFLLIKSRNFSIFTHAMGIRIHVYLMSWKLNIHTCILFFSLWASIQQGGGLKF